MRDLKPHMICLQETRQPLKNTTSYNYINKCRESQIYGGGIAIGISNQLIFKDITELLPLEI